MLLSFYLICYLETSAQDNLPQQSQLYATIGAMARTPNFSGSNMPGNADSYKTMSGFGGNIGLIYYTKFGFNMGYDANFRYDFIHYTDALKGDNAENYEFISDHSLILTRSFRQKKKIGGYYGIGFTILNFNKGYYFQIDHPTIPSSYHKLQAYTINLVAALQINQTWTIEPRIMIGRKDNPFGLPQNPVFGMMRIYYQIPVFSFHK